VRPPALILVTDRSLGGVSRGAVLAPSACAQVEEHQREEQEDERHPPYASQAERNGQAGGKHAGDKTGLEFKWSLTGWNTSTRKLRLRLGS
jgi:hypothetical protein